MRPSTCPHHRPCAVRPPGLASILLLVVTGLARPVVAATRHVPAAYPSIQAAIDAAVPGDEIVVAAGTYLESIDFGGKAVTVRSAAGPAATTIDGTGSDVSVVRCVSGESAASRLEGFTITGGVGTLEGTRRKGGGMLNRQSSPTVVDCRFVSNSISAYDFDVEGGGGGMYNEDAAPTIVRCAFIANELYGCTGWLNGGAGMYNETSSPTIVDTLFEGNTGNNGGAVMNASGSHAVLVNCVVRGNAVTYSGGGVNSTEASSAALVGCVITGNTAYHGAGVYTTGSHVTLASCTVTGNEASTVGGGLFTMFSTTASAVDNSIFWGNAALEEPAGKEIAKYGGLTTVVRRSDVEGGFDGPGNLDVDPEFVSAVGNDGVAGTADDQLALRPGSPCIDAGDTALLPPDELDVDDDGDVAEPLPVDAAGADRVAGGAVDMGALEQPGAATCAGDLDGDGIVAFADLLLLLQAWGECGGCAADVNANGAVEFGDLVVLLAAWGGC